MEMHEGPALAARVRDGMKNSTKWFENMVNHYQYRLVNRSYCIVQGQLASVKPSFLLEAYFAVAGACPGRLSPKLCNLSPIRYISSLIRSLQFPAARFRSHRDHAPRNNASVSGYEKRIR